jgi:hypothetical protein
VDVRPGDLDVAPALDRENLIHLAQALLEIEAVLPETKKLGHWEPQPDGERKWISREATPEDLQKRADWSPDPADVSILDHLFHTRYGNFDIVPELYGGYGTLIKRGRKVNVYGHEVWVAHVDELLAALTVPRRKTDVSRVQKLREIQRLLDE